MDGTMTHVTASELYELKLCPQRCHYKYGLLLRREAEKEALSRGTAVHAFIEGLRQKLPVEPDCRMAAARALGVKPVIDPDDPDADSVRANFIYALVDGVMTAYAEHYAEEDAKYRFEPEIEMVARLYNPETRMPSRNYLLAGKADALTHSGDYLWETKSTTESILPDSQYWRRLRYNPQISIYYELSQQTGRNPRSIVYDVIRFPQIRPLEHVAVRDADGCPIIFDENGYRPLKKDKTPYRTIPSGKEGLWTAQQRKETPTEYRDRAYQSAKEAPENFFQRRMIERLENVQREVMQDVWDTVQIYHEMRRRKIFPRNVSRQTCQNCDYEAICLMRDTPVGPDEIPSGYFRAERKHTELEEI